MADTLALFDLDFTLVPFDSGLRWARFMVGEGVLVRGTDEAYLDVCRGYVAGRTSIEALHRFAAAHLLAIAAEDVPALQARFEAEFARSSRAPAAPWWRATGRRATCAASWHGSLRVKMKARRGLWAWTFIAIACWR